MSKPSHESGPFQAEDDAASKYPAQTAEDASARANNSAAYRAQLEAQPHVILESIEADHTDAREEKQTTPDSSAMYSSDDAMEYDSDDEEEEEETIEAVGVGPVIVNGRPIHGGLRPLPSQQSQESALIAAVIGNLSPNLDIGSSPSAFDSEFDDLSGSDIDAADDTIQAERGPADRRSHQDISPAASPTRPTRSPSEFGEGPLISPIDQEFHEVICPTILVRQPEYVQDGSSPSVSPTTMPQALAVDTGSRYPAPIVELGDPYVEERFRPQPCPDMGYDLDLLNEGEVIEVASQSAYVGPLMLQESVRESVHPSIEHDRLDTDMTDPGVSQPIADDTHDTASARAFPKSWPSSKARIEGILSRAPIGALVDTALAWSYAGARLTEPAKSIKHIASRADWEETTGDSVPYWQLELLYEHRKAQLSSMDSSERPDLKLEQLSRQEAAGGAAGFAAKARGIRVPLRSAATSGGAAVDSDPDCVSRLTKEEWLESLGIGDGVRTRQTRGKRQASRPDRRSDTAGSDSVHSRAAARPSRMSRKDAVETAKNSSNGITAIKRAAGMKTSSARLHGADARSLYPELPTSLQGYWSRGPASTDTCEAHTSIPMYCPPSCNGDRQTVLRLLSTVGQRGAPRTAFNGVWRAESFDPQLTKLASLWGSSIPELRDEITQMWQGWKNIRKHPDLVQQGLSGNPSAIVHYLLTPRDVQGSSGQASVATSIAVKDDRVVGDEILVMGSGD